MLLLLDCTAHYTIKSIQYYRCKKKSLECYIQNIPSIHFKSQPDPGSRYHLTYFLASLYIKYGFNSMSYSDAKKGKD